uniref:Uncharacterized protein n=1 Tax=Schistocephalus solidus TaxID=70667 RepID=A0A0X3NPB3_SCHSO
MKAGAANSSRHVVVLQLLGSLPPLFATLSADWFELDSEESKLQRSHLLNCLLELVFSLLSVTLSLRPSPYRLWLILWFCHVLDTLFLEALWSLRQMEIKNAVVYAKLRWDRTHAENNNPTPAIGIEIHTSSA